MTPTFLDVLLKIMLTFEVLDRFWTVEALKNASSNVTPRIVGGHLAHVGQFPYQVAIVHYKEGLLCGGSIVTADWILTAAHCFEHNLRGHYGVLVGSVDLSSGQEYTVGKIVVNKNYETTTIENDISMVKLTRPIEFNYNVGPIELDFRTIGLVECTAIGWGQTSFYKEKPSLVLNYINLKTIGNAICQKMYMEYAGKEIKDSNICTMAVSGGTGTCYMDSGGPLVAEGKQIGIISFGAKCGVYPDVYTRISSFSQWIEDTMRYYI